MHTCFLQKHAHIHTKYIHINTNKPERSAYSNYSALNGKLGRSSKEAVLLTSNEVSEVYVHLIRRHDIAKFMTLVHSEVSRGLCVFSY